MPETIDMSKARHRTGRSKRSIARYWRSRFEFFIDAGFTEEEAVWGADNGLSLSSTEVKLLAKHRKALVALYVGPHYKFTKEKAIKLAAEDLQEKLDKASELELNLFYEVSP